MIDVLFTELPPDFPSAVCLQTDPDLFFPEYGRRDQARAAKQMCRTCPHIQECFEWVMAHPQDHGIYGGLTAKERNKITRKRSAA